MRCPTRFLTDDLSSHLLNVLPYVSMRCPTRFLTDHYGKKISKMVKLCFNAVSYPLSN